MARSVVAVVVAVLLQAWPSLEAAPPRGEEEVVAVKRGSLAVVSVVRKRQSGLEEWMEHHVAEGASSFVLIAPVNDPKISPQFESRTTVLKIPLEKSFYETCRKALEIFRVSEDWVAFLEPWEFLWAPYSLKLTEVLERAPPEVGQILTPYIAYALEKERPTSLLRQVVRREEPRDTQKSQKAKGVFRRNEVLRFDKKNKERGYALGPDLVTKLPWSNHSSFDKSLLVKGKFDLIRLNAYERIKNNNKKRRILSSRKKNDQDEERTEDEIEEHRVVEDYSLALKRILCDGHQQPEPERKSAVAFYGRHRPRESSGFLKSALENSGFEVVRLNATKVKNSGGASLASLALTYAAVAVLHAREAPFANPKTLSRAQAQGLARCKRLLASGATFCTLDELGFLWQSEDLQSRRNPAAAAGSVLRARGSWPPDACVVRPHLPSQQNIRPRGATTQQQQQQHKTSRNLRGAPPGGIRRTTTTTTTTPGLPPPPLTKKKRLSWNLVEPRPHQVLSSIASVRDLRDKHAKLTLTLSMPREDIFQQVNALVVVACLAKLLDVQFLFPTSYSLGVDPTKTPAMALAFDPALAQKKFRTAGVKATRPDDIRSGFCDLEPMSFAEVKLDARTGLPAYELDSAVFASGKNSEDCDDELLLRFGHVDPRALEVLLPSIDDYSTLARVLVNAMEPSAAVIDAAQKARTHMLSFASDARTATTKRLGCWDERDLLKNDVESSADCPLCRLADEKIDALYVGGASTAPLRITEDEDEATQKQRQQAADQRSQEKLKIALKSLCPSATHIYTWSDLRLNIPELDDFSFEERRLIEFYLMQEADFFWGASDSGLTNHVIVRRLLRGQRATSAITRIKKDAPDLDHVSWLMNKREYTWLRTNLACANGQN